MIYLNFDVDHGMNVILRPMTEKQFQKLLVIRNRRVSKLVLDINKNDYGVSSQTIMITF